MVFGFKTERSQQKIDKEYHFHTFVSLREMGLLVSKWKAVSSDFDISVNHYGAEVTVVMFSVLGKTVLARKLNEIIY